jgi:pyridoxine kinase
VFTAALIEGLAAPDALQRATAAVADLVAAATAWAAPELPIVAAAARLVSPGAAVRLEVVT